MTRKNLFYVVIAFIAGVTVWIFYVNRGLRETQDIIVEQASRPVRRVSSPSPVPTLVNKNGNQAVRTRLIAQFQTLQQQLIVEQQKLDQQERELQVLREAEEQKNQPSEEPTNNSSQISATSSQISEFIEELSSYDRLESEINRRASEALRDQNSQAQVLKDQLSEMIQNQEGLIRQTQDEIIFWQYNGSYVNAREARQAELQSLLESQQQQLADLRQQRLNISADILAQTRFLQEDKAQALSDLSESRNELRGEIQDLRGEIYRLQVQESQKRTSQVSSRAQLLQRQRDYEKQKQQVKSISDLLLEKNEEINLLR